LGAKKRTYFGWHFNLQNCQGTLQKTLAKDLKLRDIQAFWLAWKLGTEAGC